MTKWGYPDSDWERAKQEAKTVLGEIAHRRRTIAYSELSARIRTIAIPEHAPAFSHFLGEISTEEDESGRGLLTVLVVRKGGDMRPGPGFFELARARGRTFRTEEQGWVQELHRVYDAWSGKP